MIGKDITKLQELIKQLEEMQKEENKTNVLVTNTVDNTLSVNNTIK